MMVKHHNNYLFSLEVFFIHRHKIYCLICIKTCMLDLEKYFSDYFLLFCRFSVNKKSFPRRLDAQTTRKVTAYQDMFCFHSDSNHTTADQIRLENVC